MHAVVGGMSSSDESVHGGEKKESAVHKMNSSFAPMDRERAEAAARVTAHTILTSGQSLTVHQKQMLMTEHRNDMSMQRRGRTTALQDFYGGAFVDDDDDVGTHSASALSSDCCKLLLYIFPWI